MFLENVHGQFCAVKWTLKTIGSRLAFSFTVAKLYHNLFIVTHKCIPTHIHSLPLTQLGNWEWRNFQTWTSRPRNKGVRWWVICTAGYLSSHRENGCVLQYDFPGTLWLPWKKGYGGFAFAGRCRYVNVFNRLFKDCERYHLKCGEQNYQINKADMETMY